MPPPPADREPQRIAKLLARAGIASRREIERMIEERRIAIDGVAVEKPATLLTSLHGVTVDGQPVKAPAPARLFRYHKPPGLLTAARDPKGRPTIYDRLPAGLPRLMPVGRLDMNTEGLLLLTTDGELKRQLELPSTGVERSYRARVFGDVSQEQLEELIHGVEIEGIRYGAIDANLERRTGRNGWVEMKLTEGKNREVRRVLEYLGLQVSRLIRTAYGPLVLGDLPAGAVDEIRQHDLVAFRKELKRAPGDRDVVSMPRHVPVERPDRAAARGQPRPQRASPESRAALRGPTSPDRDVAGKPKRVPAERRHRAAAPAQAGPQRGRAGPESRDARKGSPSSDRDVVRMDKRVPAERAERPAAAKQAGPHRGPASPDSRDARKGTPSARPQRRPREEGPRPSPAGPGARRPGRPSPSRGGPR